MSEQMLRRMLAHTKSMCQAIEPDELSDDTDFGTGLDLSEPALCHRCLGGGKLITRYTTATGCDVSDIRPCPDCNETGRQS